MSILSVLGQASDYLARDNEEAAWQVLHYNFPLFQAQGQITEDLAKEVYGIMLGVFSPSSDGLSKSIQKAEKLHALALKVDLSGLLETLTEEAMKEKKTSPLSVCLLGAAQLKNQVQYKALLSEMISALETDSQDNGYKAWMWGRILFSSFLVGMPEVSSMAYVKQQELISSAEKNACTGWAYGYRAMYEAATKNNQYRSSIEEGIKIAAKSPEQASRLWIYSLLLPAAAFANKKTVYDDVATIMKQDTCANSLGEAIEKIPEGDWRAWALALGKIAAAKMEPSAVENLSSATLKAAGATTSKGNRLMAMLTLGMSEPRELPETN